VDASAAAAPSAAADRERFDQLLAVIQRLSLARSLAEIQGIVRVAARALTGADGASFVLRDDQHSLHVDEDAISPLWKGQRFPLCGCISGWTMLNSRVAAIPDIYADARIAPEIYRRTFVKSLAMVPIGRRAPLGAIGSYWAEPHVPTGPELQALLALADCTAVAIESARAWEEVAVARLETVQRLARAGEMRDDATCGHSERVGRTASLLAERMDWPPEMVEQMRRAAPLHDIGKLSISDAVLRKRGRLATDEFEQVKNHTWAGAAILAGSEDSVLNLAEEIALTHHEWWDGSGYPVGLRGTEIPESGRIVAVADVFDALTRERPYKDAWAVEDAIEEIRRLSGRQFEPVLVDAFTDIALESSAASVTVA
jgi:putative two-component system response regulator